MRARNRLQSVHPRTWITVCVIASDHQDVVAVFLEEHEIRKSTKNRSANAEADAGITRRCFDDLRDDARQFLLSSFHGTAVDGSLS